MAAQSLAPSPTMATLAPVFLILSIIIAFYSGLHLAKALVEEYKNCRFKSSIVSKIFPFKTSWLSANFLAFKDLNK
jgi:hypothetical protein